MTLSLNQLKYMRETREEDNYYQTLEDFENPPQRKIDNEYVNKNSERE